MSNVLIGIIGVIVFIGLAMAGALFLGPRFQKAAAESEAATATSTIQQIQAAYSMRAVETGDDRYVMGAIDSLSPGYLRNPPPNPTRGGRLNASRYEYVPHVNNDVLNDADDEGGPPVGEYVMMAIGTDDFARSTCDSMNRGLGITTTPIINWDGRRPKQHIACGFGEPFYIAFARLR